MANKKYKKEVRNLNVEVLDRGDEFGRPAGDCYAKFSFEFEGHDASFEVDKRRRHYGTEPYNCEGISEQDAQKVLSKYKKIDKTNEKDPEKELDEEDFEI